MEAIKNYQRYVNHTASLFAGVLFVFATITVFGYGAAIAIPQSILEPLARFSAPLAFALVDLITLGLPAALVFSFFVLVLKLLRISVFYILITMPFILFMSFSVTDLLISTDDSLIYLSSSLAKVLPVVLCALFLAKQDKASNGA